MVRAPTANAVASPIRGPRELRLESIQQRKEWTTSTNNPDYNLAVINAANTGFKAKAGVETGSFLTSLFARGVQQDSKRRRGQGLAAIMGGIQDILHSKGMQLPVSTFNNRTRTLRMKVNQN